MTIPLPLVPPSDATTARLFRDYHDKVRRWAIRLVRSPSDADDIVQDVFLAAYRHCQLKGELPHPGPWLLKTASNLSRHFWRSKLRQATRDLLWDRLLLGPEVATPLEQVEAKFTAHRLGEALAGLVSAHADVHMLFDLHDVPATTAAAIVGLRPATLRVRRFRARSIVARCLARMEAEEATGRPQAG
jgi:RNA polymerase sigma-70 factor (ECF subfamily)